MIENRVAIFLPNLGGGGAERVLVNLANGLVKQGFHIDFLLASAVGPHLKDLDPAVAVVNFEKERVRYALIPLIRYLRKVRPHALIAGLGNANMIASAAKILARSKTRLILTVHNNLILGSQKNNIDSRVKTKVQGYLFQKADAVVAVSKGVADDVENILGIDKKLIEVIYNPVITEELLADLKKPVYHPWFEGQGPPVILAAGRHVPQKDFPNLLHAFAIVHKQSGARLVILSDGPDKENLIKLANELDLNEVVDFAGYVDNIYGYMAKADLFVLSSAWEGLPTVLVEALACGTAVVSTDCPHGPRELLLNGKYGLLVPVGDSKALADGILTVLVDEDDEIDYTEAWRPFLVEYAANRYAELLRRPQV